MMVTAPSFAKPEKQLRNAKRKNMVIRIKPSPFLILNSNLNTFFHTYSNIIPAIPKTKNTFATAANISLFRYVPDSSKPNHFSIGKKIPKEFRLPFEKFIQPTIKKNTLVKTVNIHG